MGDVLPQHLLRGAVQQEPEDGAADDQGARFRGVREVQRLVYLP